MAFEKLATAEKVCWILLHEVSDAMLLIDIFPRSALRDDIPGVPTLS